MSYKGYFLNLAISEYDKGEDYCGSFSIDQHILQKVCNDNKYEMKIYF